MPTEKPNPQQKSVDQLIDKELSEGRSMDEMIDRFRNRLIVRALVLCEGNQCHAAAMLKTHRNTVVRWIHEWNLDPHNPVVLP